MATISDFFAKTIKTLKSNSPEILTALGVSGVVTTSYLTAKASFRSAVIIGECEDIGGTNPDRKERFKDRTKLVWKEYIPPTISGALTIACIIGSYKGSGKRTAAAVTAYSLAEKAFTEYKEKVVEQIGEGKEQKIRDEIAQDRVNEFPPCEQDVIVLGGGQVLCCELFTRRYFRSDMETLRKAQNSINALILHDTYVALDEFYDLLGLSSTSNSSKIGWDSDKLMELKFSTVLSENSEPCLAFDYNYTKPLK